MARTATAAAAIRWVGHPATIVAAVVLLINDHVLKPAWPGLVTGKLSDVAGLVVAPALLELAAALVAPRAPGRWVALGAVIATGAGFSWVKLTGAGAAVASAAWSVVAGPSYVLADPTDLIALPALGLAWWAWRRAAAQPPPDEALTTRVRVLVALPLTLLAVVATPAPAEPGAITVVAEHDGEVVIAGNILPLASTTGINGWQPLSEAEARSFSPEDDLGWRRQEQDCVPDKPEHCYRVWGGHVPSGSRNWEAPAGGRLLGVDETADGGRTWHTAWEIPAGRWLFLAREHELWRDRDDDLLASVDILVRNVPGGHQVIVANGAEGLAVRDPDGEWRQVAVDAQAVSHLVRSPEPAHIGPAPRTGFGRGLVEETALATVLIVIALFMASGVLGWRLQPARPVSAVLMPVLAGLTLMAHGVIGLSALLFFNSMPLSVFTAAVLAACVLGAAVAQPALSRSRAAFLAAAILQVGVLFVTPYLGWTIAVPDRYETATALAWAMAAAGAVAVVVVAWWAGGAVNPRRPAPPGQSTGSGAPSKSTIE